MTVLFIILFTTWLLFLLLFEFCFWFCFWFYLWCYSWFCFWFYSWCCNQFCNQFYNQFRDLYFNIYTNIVRSTTRFICTTCWLRIFCKLCLSEELNNLIDRAVTARYAHVTLTYTDWASHCDAHKQQDHMIKWLCDQTANESSCRSDQLSQYTDWALHHDAHKQLKAHLVCLTRWSNSERKLTSKWSTFTIHRSLV